MFSGVTSHASLSGNLRDEFDGCQENGTCLTVKFGGGGIMECWDLYSNNHDDSIISKSVLLIMLRFIINNLDDFDIDCLHL